MGIMELGAIGELVGGLAVVGSRLYVGLQVRQGNRLARAQANEEIARLASDFTLHISPQELELMLRGATDIDGLSDVDRVLLLMRVVTLLNYYERLFYARERREVDDDLWESRVQRMRGMFGLFLPLWETQKTLFGRRFREFIDAEIVTKIDRRSLVLPNALREPGRA